MEYLKTLWVSVFVVIALVACGGGGGLAGGGEPLPGAAINITEANAVPVTAAVVGSVEVVQGLSEGGTGAIIGVATETAGGGFNMADFVLQQLDRFAVVREQALVNSAVGVAIDPPISGDCDNLNLGTITITGDVADPTLNSIAVGDNVVLTMTNCEMDGLVANGGFTLTVVAFSDNIDTFIPPYSLTVDVVVTDFTVNDGLSTFSGDGDMTLTLAGNADGTRDMIATGTQLTATEAGFTTVLANYLYELTENVFTLDYSLDMSGELDSSALGGSVMFNSTTTFAGFGEGYPGAGVLLITGADGSQCRLRTIDAVNVEIDVDADGDGVFETTINDTWANLTA
ncbi:MAG: hypothetical protein OEN52_04420 [Gammaproteobacteria bacterium]|nr:hypothetical protein [Gammaproteobacteria bacterium]